MRLYVEGHHHKRGHAISRSWSDHECRTLPIPTDEELKPVRYVRDIDKAKELVQRWNRRFATH